MSIANDFHFSRTLEQDRIALLCIALYCMSFHSDKSGWFCFVLFYFKFHEMESKFFFAHLIYKIETHINGANPFAAFLFSFTFFRKLLTKSWPLGRVKMKG